MLLRLVAELVLIITLDRTYGGVDIIARFKMALGHADYTLYEVVDEIDF